MRQTGGEVVLWGRVHRYQYYYAEGKALVFSTGGELLGERDRSVPDKASAHHQGKLIF